MKMEDQYCISDLQQLMSSSSRPQPQQFPAIRPPDLFSGHRNLTSPPQPYDVMMAVGMSRGLHPAVGAGNSASPAMAAASSATSSLGGLEMEAGPFGIDGGSGRWPRQETLTLLEIRSRLDSKFREANQKGPLWDEVSRIMSEEHGYQRSGKKCREKFENLYKYYKKTKEGKAGRQDGKHYRFFRQLEALYGEASNSASASETQVQFQSTSLTPHTNYQDQTAALLQTPKLCDSLSLSYSSDFNSSSSDDDMNNALMDNDSAERGKKRRNVRRGWKAKIKDFIDSQMRKLMEKQEVWLEKMMKSIERREQERSLREEEWRREEAERFEKERRVWASERARIEARDAALMDALHKLTGAKTRENRRVEEENNGWEEPEITRLIHVRTSMEARFQESGGSEEVIWEEIAAKMSCLGYERTGTMCKGKWDSINDYLRKTNSYKKRKENITRSSSNFSFYQNPNDSFYNEERVYCNQTRPPTSETAANCNNVVAVSVAGNPENDICFPFLMGDGGNLWENYGVKINKGDSP